VKTRLVLIVLLGMSLALGRGGQLPADEAKKTAGDPQQAKIKELLEQAVNWYAILPEAGAKVSLCPQIVQRWQNPVRIETGAGLLVIWTDQGRPEAMARIFVWDGDICHEFGSLSRKNKLVARDERVVVWSPAKPGVDFREVPDAPDPADSPAARLRQMKAIAERVTARLLERNSGGRHEVLRLLPRPLYRYEVKEAQEADPSLVDGGMFAFAMGTDPEVVLLLEASGHEDDAVWKYAFTRATGWTADASFGKEVVWTESTDPAVREPTRPQMQIRRPLP